LGRLPCRYLTDAPIDVAELLRRVAGAEHGGVCTFLGTARRHSSGKEVVELRYESYPQMADEAIDGILRRVVERHPGVAIDALHRLGVCPIGEASVAVVAAAAHRDAAFAACRMAIDEIKELAPIWKQEVYRDGTAWIGDPSPPPAGAADRER